MLASRFFERTRFEHGMLYNWSERGFDALAKGYDGRSMWPCISGSSPCAFSSHRSVLSVYRSLDTERLFPQQETGLITASPGGADISFAKISTPARARRHRTGGSRRRQRCHAVGGGGNPFEHAGASSSL